MRKKLIAANWKMYKTPNQAREFLATFMPHAWGHTRDEIVICPPFVCIPATVEAAQGSGIGVGGQDMHWEQEGAFTGAISAHMLMAAGCTHVVIGHSERRQYFGETDQTVNHKLKAALEAGLCPICCIGETLQERQAEQTLAQVGKQLEEGLADLGPLTGEQLVLAYEPVWAIGTGLTATPAQAQEVHAFIRSRLREILGAAAEDVRILYGGSVTPDNAATLLSEVDIDGALVGGASLKASSFLGIITAAG